MSLLFVPKLEGEGIGLFTTASESCSWVHILGNLHHALSLLEEETTKEGEGADIGMVTGESRIIDSCIVFC